MANYSMFMLLSLKKLTDWRWFSSQILCNPLLTVWNLLNSTFLCKQRGLRWYLVKMHCFASVKSSQSKELLERDVSLCVFVSSFESVFERTCITDQSSCFTTLVRFSHVHTHSYTNGRGCHASCQLLIRSNLGFSIRLKDSSACS